MRPMDEIGTRLSEIKSLSVGLSRDLRKLRQAHGAPPDEDAAAALIRHCVCLLCAEKNTKFPADVFRERYPDLERRMVAKAVINPGDMKTPSWAGELISGQAVGALLASGPAPSAYAQFAALGLEIGGKLPATIPFPQTQAPAGAWVGERQAIPVAKIALSSVLLTPCKVAVISLFSDELKQRSTPDIEQVLRLLLAADLGKVIDATLVDDVAATTLRPAGLRAGIAATPSVDMETDLKALAAAVLNAGGLSVCYLMNPLQALALSFLAQPLAFPVIMSTAIAPGLVIAADPASFASSIGAPKISVGAESTVHEETMPVTDLMTGSPVRNLWQTNTTGIRLIIPAAWAVAGQRVAWMSEVSW